MESTQQRRSWRIVVWLLISASLLLSLIALNSSSRPSPEELERLDAQIRQLEIDLANLKATVEKRQQTAEDVVNTVGTHNFYGGKLTVTVSDDEGGLNYRITRVHDEDPARVLSFGPMEPFFKDRDHWFVCMESVDSVWVFDGRDMLTWVEFQDGTVTEKDSVAVPAIVKRAPEAVRDRLPQSFLERFKEEAPTGGTTEETE